MMWTDERLAEIAADQVFIAQFCAKGSASSLPVKPAVEAYPIDITPIIIVFHLAGLSTIALIAIVVLVPVDGRMKVYVTLFRLGLYGSEKLRGMLILVVCLPTG